MPFRAAPCKPRSVAPRGIEASQRIGGRQMLRTSFTVALTRILALAVTAALMAACGALADEQEDWCFADQE
jgi:hypothetical protein